MITEFVWTFKTTVLQYAKEWEDRPCAHWAFMLALWHGSTTQLVPIINGEQKTAGVGTFLMSMFQGTDQSRSSSPRVSAVLRPRLTHSVEGTPSLVVAGLKWFQLRPVVPGTKWGFPFYDNQSLISPVQVRQVTHISFIDDSSPKNRVYTLWIGDMWMKSCTVSQWGFDWSALRSPLHQLT